MKLLLTIIMLLFISCGNGDSANPTTPATPQDDDSTTYCDDVLNSLDYIQVGDEWDSDMNECTSNIVVTVTSSGQVRTVIYFYKIDEETETWAYFYAFVVFFDEEIDEFPYVHSITK